MKLLVFFIPWLFLFLLLKSQNINNESNKLRLVLNEDCLKKDASKFEVC